MQVTKQTKDDLILQQIKYKSFAKMLLMVLNICLSSFYFGYSIQYLGTFDFYNIIDLYHIDMGKKDFAEGLFNACVPIGGGIGALSSFFLLKKFSRKNSLLIVNAIAFTFGCLLFIPNQYTFLLSRLMQGICVGLYSAISPLIIKQFAPVQIAGTLGSFNQLFISFGVFFACLLQYILKSVYNSGNQNDDSKEKSYYFIMFGFTLITILLQSILLMFVYRFQTPRYLLEKGREADCRQVIYWIYKEEYVDEIMQEKKQDLGIKASTTSEFQETEVVQPKMNKLRFAVAIHLAMLQQFVGINAVVIYGTGIAGTVFPGQKNLIPVILNLQQTLTCLVTSYLLIKFGRKQIMQAGTFVAVLAQVLIGVGFLIAKSHSTSENGFWSYMIVAGLFIFMADFGLSLGPVVWLYIPEILQPSRIAFSTLANWTVAALITILFPILKQTFGTPAPLFLFYAAYSLAGFIFSQKFMIETKGKSQKEIYGEYDKLA